MSRCSLTDDYLRSKLKAILALAWQRSQYQGSLSRRKTAFLSNGSQACKHAANHYITTLRASGEYLGLTISNFFYQLVASFLSNQLKNVKNCAQKWSSQFLNSRNHLSIANSRNIKCMWFWEKSAKMMHYCNCVLNF